MLLYASIHLVSPLCWVICPLHFLLFAPWLGTCLYFTLTKGSLFHMLLYSRALASLYSSILLCKSSSLFFSFVRVNSFLLSSGFICTILCPSSRKVDNFICYDTMYWTFNKFFCSIIFLGTIELNFLRNLKKHVGKPNFTSMVKTSKFYVWSEGNF